MDELKDVRAAVDDRAQVLASRNWKASIFVKIVLISLAALLSAIAQFADVPSGSSISNWGVIGIFASMLIFLGAVFVIWTEHDSSIELREAQKALLKAEEKEKENMKAKSEYNEVMDKIEDFVSDSDLALSRATSLYNATMAMRSVIEGSIQAMPIDEVQILDTLVRVCRFPLPVAMGVEQRQQWTICIYRAEPETLGSSRIVLRIVAHLRAVECKASEARVWPAGVGVTGIAYANRREIIVPDAFGEGVGSTFELGGDLNRDYDLERYRSYVAVPVFVGSDDMPWGVVVGTNDVPDHFSSDHDTGVRASEAIRALAGMVELGVSVSRTQSATRASQPLPSGS